MGGLTIIIVAVVFTIITIILITIFVHYNKQAHQCDSDLLFWCNYDWKCYYGTNDPHGGLVGVYNGNYDAKGAYMPPTGSGVPDYSKMPLSCYILGMFSRMDQDDECKPYLNSKYQKSSVDKCTNDIESQCATIESGDDMFPCGCGKLTGGGGYGDILNKGTGFNFTMPDASQSNVGLNKESEGLKGNLGCIPGDSGCTNFSNVFCNMIGQQIGACKS